jgi:glycosyltransferase involved in cell wall biosynthesis
LSKCEEALISAIVPNFNHGALIAEAIVGLASQAPVADEIIVVDDASTDDSIEVVAKLRSRIPRLRLLRNWRNQGAIAAMNRGLHEARGRYVYFGAADDLTQPELFENMLAALRQHPEAAFACCEAILHDTASGHIGYRPAANPVFAAAYLAPQDVLRSLRRTDNWIVTGTALIRRDLLVASGGFDSELGSFADSYALRRLALLHGCCFVPFLGLEWRVSSRGLSRSLARDPIRNAQILKAALRRMGTDPAFPAWYPKLFERRWRFGIGRLAIGERPINRVVLVDQCARGWLSAAVLALAVFVGGPIGRLFALAWLTLQERPMSIPRVLATTVKRRSMAWVRQCRPAANATTPAQRKCTRPLV